MTNQLEKVYFTTKEALEDIKYHLESGYRGYLCDLHIEVFNTDYYIIGTYLAEKALEQYGVFNAIREIKEYEENHFGESLISLDDPEKVTSMLYYIVGENAISAIMDDELIEFWNDEVSEEIKDLITTKIDSLLAEME